MGNTPSILDSPPSTPSTNTPCHSPSSPPLPPRKSRAKNFYLFLDVQTTTEDLCQIVTLDAVLYSTKQGDHPSTMLVENAMSAIVRPKRGYSVLRHMQDVRYHGVPAKTLGEKGQDTFAVVNQLFVMLRIAMRLSEYSVQDTPATTTLTVVGHGVEGMMSNFMAAAKIDKTLHPLWDELEDLCQQTHDTMDDALHIFPDLTNYTVASLLGLYDRPMPRNRAQAVADLYVLLSEERPIEF